MRRSSSKNNIAERNSRTKTDPVSRRPRVRTRYTNAAGVSQNFIDRISELPGRERMVPAHSYQYRDWMDYGKQRRWLDSQVGKPMDAVRSQLHRDLRGKSYSMRRLREEILNLIAPFADVEERNGNIIDITTGRPVWQRFYVDAEGILRHTPRRTMVKAQAAKKYLGTDDDMRKMVLRQNKRGELIWFVVELAKAPMAVAVNDSRRNREYCVSIECVFSDDDRKHLGKEYGARLTVVDAWGFKRQMYVTPEQYKSRFASVETLPRDAVFNTLAYSQSPEVQRTWGAVDGRGLYATAIRAASKKEIDRWVRQCDEDVRIEVLDARRRQRYSMLNEPAATYLLGDLVTTAPEPELVNS